MMRASEICTLLSKLKAGDEIPGALAGKVYKFVKLAQYSGRGRFVHLKGDPIVVLESSVRKRPEITLFMEPLTILLEADADEVTYGRKPRNYFRECHQRKPRGIPNVQDYLCHYKAVARFIRSLMP